MSAPVLPGMFDPPVSDVAQPVDAFDGETYEPEADQVRLSQLLARVYDVMRDGRWRTLREITEALGGASEASVSARLRDLRKVRFGAHVVERRRRGEAAAGIFKYRVTQ